MDICDCGFDDDSVRREDIPDRVRLGVSSMGALLRAAPENSLEHPSASRWSMVEYAAHVRDVLLTMRDRLVIGLVEDNPSFKPLYRDQRIDLGLYRSDTPEVIVSETKAAAEMFIRLFTEIDPGLLGRRVQFGSPGPVERTLEWMGKQVVHEIEHHLDDIRENRAMLNG